MARRLLVLGTPVALLAAGWLIFYVLKVPPHDTCDTDLPGGAVESYRRGLGAYGSFCAAVLGGLLAWVSPGPRTRSALVVCGWLVLVYNAENAVFEVHAGAAFFAAVVGGEVLLVAAALGVLAMQQPRVAELTYLWTALLVFLPAAVGWVAADGTTFGCFD